MAYSELIKDFERIRDYMRAFYVYGFKQRGEYDAKSARSYDNERRRIESWLGEYMSFHRDADGKHVFLSVDSRAILHNPLYKAFKAKSFTAKDVMLHFYLLDLLRNGQEMTVKEIVDELDKGYLAAFDAVGELDESTLRKKLKEYEELGLIQKEKSGRKVVYSRSKDEVDMESWKDALSFFTEADPLGVMGSFLLDKYDEIPEYYRFKHHYILHALDSEVLCGILETMAEGHLAEIQVKSRALKRLCPHLVYPSRIYVSTQNGRQYLMGYSLDYRRMMFFRLDNITAVKDSGAGSPEIAACCEAARKEQEQHVWGVSCGNGKMQHLEMLIRVEDGEFFIVDRLEREKRCGQVEKIDEHTYRFSANVFDAGELLPWIRTFIGRIVGLTCSDESVTKTFWDDFRKMEEMYGASPAEEGTVRG